ncbi:hypothetical protein MWN33_09965 [Starkeya koreensis]|uniref:Transcriptional regulator, AlpA family n=1 Tax=Ancylobacter koreensis TaxID=266121 RepID=A0ABT0DM59_9HYPH|nr:hypothetical protein [Ancylobacter koreensis]MCK0208356.1 hypothetical protein [Ancylobacter koreensis]
MANPAPNQIRFAVEPRLVPPTKAARRLHLTLAEFNLKREALYRAGFPQACSVTGHYDLVAIDAWLDRRSGVGAVEDVMAEARRKLDARRAARG